METNIDSGNITRDDVIWCYNHILKRSPESENVIQYFLNEKDFRTLCEMFIKSDEFQNQMKAPDCQKGSFYLPLKNSEVRLAALEMIAREVYARKIMGAAAEVGVYKGHFARHINHFFPDRRLYLFDTFEGFDERDTKTEVEHNFSDGKQDFSDTTVKAVLKEMERKEMCIVKKGYFPDTAAGVEDEFVFVSLDADLYKPILAGLDFFYPRLVHGGSIMVHDFNNQCYKGARQAVTEFCDRERIGYFCLSDLCGSAVITK